jgi:adenine phosphoribosyltransferase
LSIDAVEHDDAMALIDSAIRVIPDFPKAGIQFRDITPLIAEPRAFAAAIDALADLARPFAPEVIVAVEARGFLFGAPLALALGIGLVPARKPGKLPADVHEAAYGLEYGSDKLQMHTDAAAHGARALLIDDLLATGGTVAAATDLVRRVGAEAVGALFLIELDGLGGRAKLETLGVPCAALLSYPA